MAKTVSKSYNSRDWQTVVLLGLVTLSVISYIFLVYRVTFYAVGKQVARQEIVVLTDKVTILETRALILSSKMTVDLAYALGFRDSSDQTFYTASRETSPRFVSWRNDVNE